MNIVFIQIRPNKRNQLARPSWLLLLRGVLPGTLILLETFSVDWLSIALKDIIRLRGSILLNQKADILFLIDSSGSLGGHQFGYEKKFIKNLLNEIVVGYSATRVEVIPFSNSASRFIRFISDPKSTNNKCYFNQRFSTLTQEHGMTNMKDAFQIAYDICLGKWSGVKRFPMKVFKTVIILLTDGDWNYPPGDNDPTPIAKKLIDQKAEIFAIGVGGTVNFRNLQILVAGQKPGVVYAFHLRDFNQFNELATYIRGDPHEKQWETVDVDASMCGNRCDGQAKCACGLIKGDYNCACPAGKAGSGIRGDCKDCPPGRYKDFKGYALECTKCPDFSTHNKHGSKNHGDCECMPGYYGNPHYLTPCKPRHCSVLADPLYGSIKGRCKTTLGSECSFECDEGYRLLGDAKRQCIVDSKKKTLVTWSGTPVTCKEVKCEKLPKVPIGFYTFKEFQCDEKDQKFDTECKHNCPPGYYMLPGTIHDTTNSRTCDYKTGTWTGEPRVCKDNQVPELYCPSNIQVKNDPGEKTASVKWTFTFDDNSLRAGAPVKKEMFSKSLEINDKETSLDLPKLLEIGKNKIQYQVTDLDNNSEKCDFEVEVLDTEPPTCSFCPPSKELMVTKSNNFLLTWDRPNCTDNSGIPPETLSSIKMGSEVIAPGVYSIQYTVKDKALNKYEDCSFFIKLRVPECKAFSPPKNGLARCINYGNVLGCSVACRDTYDFVYKPASSYSCTNGKWDTWSPANDHDQREHWPDCSKRANPSETAIKALPQFYFKGDCNDPNIQAQLKQDFVTILYPPNAPPFFCLLKPRCNAQNVKIYCGEVDASARRKRSADTRQVYFEVTYVEKSNQIQAGSDDFGNQDKFKVFKQEVDKKRDEVYRSLQKVNWGAFNTKTGLDLGGINRFNLKQAEGYCSEEGAVVRKCTKDQLQYYPKRCNFDKGDITKCIRCPVGTYYNSDKEDCDICPEGSYSPNEGALECKKCPLGTWTFGDKKENFTSCQAECGPGYFSNSGIAVCFQCPAGTYSNERRNKNCTVCPAGTTSVAATSTRLEDCGMKCAPGTFSSNSVEPCTPCPLGTYQHQLGQTTCLPCPGRLSTYGTGADSSSSCFEVNDCMSSPCQNNGKCIDTKESYRCKCNAGFMGNRCQIDIDECAVNPCSQGATCLDKVNGYTCLCPEGYNGTKCEKMIETCKTKNPCVRGTCKEKGAGAECECPVGYEGQFCERNTDECALNMCHNNAVCIGGVDSFQCLCRKGFSGQICQINDNDCKTNPCQNNGKCIDRNGFYICQCSAGYSGANCEYKINECQSEPCQNGGICTDKLNGYDCACQPTYTGVNCQHRKVKPADNVNECSSNPCLNGGVCINRYSSYMCLCKQGFTGHRCDKAIPCGTLESPIYGVMHSSGSTHGSTATFTCRAGYSIKGTGTRSCQSGQWTGTQPTCEDIDECLTGGHGCNQVCINTPGSYTCACAPGYQHTSATQCSDIKECSMNNGGCSHFCHERPGGVTCSCPYGMKLLSGGRTCSDIDECSRGNGGCEHTCFNTFRSFKCLCNRGYRLNSNQRNCDGLSCPALIPVADSTKQGNSNLVGTAVRYTCNTGFRIIGSSKRECRADLQWSGVQPRCERLYCREVGTVKNAVRSLVNYYNNRPVVGSIARFACNLHHVMQGSPDRVCQADGSWSGKLPRCIPASCSKLNPPSRGTVQGYRFELGATLRITCDKGYQLKPASSSFRTCVKTPSGGGTWSGQDPVCEIVDCGNVKPPYGGYRTLPGGTKYQAVVTYTCKPQHHLQGKPSRVCQADGTWSGSQPVCLERSCGYLDPPVNGEKIGEEHQYGQSVMFKCNTGYNLIGSSNVTCQTSGQWSHSVPSCQIVNCGDPGTPVNGVRFGNTFTYMSSVFLECNPGYKLVGAIERKCQVNGQWSDTQPTCVATSCGRLRVGPTGTITSPNYPLDYGNNEYCTWEIRVPVDKKVRLNFKDFKTELGKDLLMIYDTNQKTPTIYFDGTTNMPGPFTSSGNSLRLRFISDGQTAMKGFKVDYTQIDMNCGGTLLDPKGVITSPKYPNPYDNNLDCVWLIARPNDKIAMSLLEFDTEDHHDFLAISFGREVTKKLTYEWSGLGTSIKPFGCLNYMWLRFKTNWITTGRVRKGFKIQYRGVNKNQIA
uniref:Sushi, von Willebrand factor type A, EGF and pentraxin domain-containing protein 1-like n=1 Tax=Actinia tenebrosa TaxID=6105 RepID=A0A6P8IYU7_ACTTE